MSDDNVLNENEKLEEQAHDLEVLDPKDQRIAELEEALEEAKAKAEENWDTALRTKAEAENVKRRAEKDLASAHKFAVEKFVQELIPIIDSIELGLAAVNDENADVAKFREGSELTLKMAQGLMEKFNIEQINPEGEKFDPAKHQAMSMQEIPGVEANTVINVIQKGYAMHERVVRPAMVIVSKAAPTPPTDTKIDERA